MPIRPENKARYPANWKQIADSVRVRAEHKCEKCMVRNGETVTRGELQGTHVYMLESGNAYCAETGQYIDQIGVCELSGNVRMVKIVLTVAHLDHTPENVEPENLRAWCQRCHLNYDKHHHAKTAYATRKATANTVNMFHDQESAL